MIAKIRILPVFCWTFWIAVVAMLVCFVLPWLFSAACWWSVALGIVIVVVGGIFGVITLINKILKHVNKIEEISNE